VTIAAAILAGVGRPAGAGFDSSSVYVHVMNRADIPAEVLDRAEHEVVRIYEQIGVNVVWTQDTAPGASLIVIVVATGWLNAPTAALGTALRAPGNRGRVAYVFYSRVEHVSAHSRLERGCLLGVTIAHEVGHLLLPYGSHSQTGLMRAQWNDEDLQRARDGGLGFTARQGDLIRSRLVAALDESARE
jgi:hypothetical protein